MKKLTENKYYQLGLTIFIVIAACILFYFMIDRSSSIISVLGSFIKLFTPFIIGFVIAYLLNPIVKFFNKHVFLKLYKKSKMSETKKHKICNHLSITLACIITIGLIVLLFSFVIPEVLKSIEKIIINTPTYLIQIKNYLLNKLQNYQDLSDLVLKNYDAINNYFNNIVDSSLLPKVDDWIQAFSSGFFGAIKVAANIVLGFIVSIYYLSGKDHFRAQIKKLLYSVLPIKWANSLLETARHTDKMFGNFLTGKLLDGATIGFITFLFLAIFGYPYPLLIGVMIGLTNMIPYFGPYIGTVPSALLILLNNPTKCLVFILFIIALQQLDSYFIDPRLSGAKTGIKSFWVLFAIVFFGSLFGILGLLLGVPIFALIYGYINRKCNSSLKNKDLSTKTKDYEELEYIESTNKKMIMKK